VPGEEILLVKFYFFLTDLILKQMRNSAKLCAPQQRRPNINPQLVQNSQVSTVQLALQISGDTGDSYA
jgi:hypothetical protein